MAAWYTTFALTSRDDSPEKSKLRKRRGLFVLEVKI